MVDRPTSSDHAIINIEGEDLIIKPRNKAQYTQKPSI